MDFSLIFGIATAIVTLYLCAAIFYNVFLHPLRIIPGPLFFRASILPKSYYMVEGVLQFKVKSLHDKYGPVVRIAPGEISVVGAEAWNDVYGRRTGRELPKYYSFYVLDKSSPRDIITAEPAQHRILRRLLAHGFSEKSMHAQGPIIGGYIDVLIQRLRDECDAQEAVVDLNKWLNWTTFDIIGNLSFGSDLSNLRSADWNPWVKASAKHNKAMAIIACLKGMGFGIFIKLVVQTRLLLSQGYLDYIKSQVEHRMLLGVERPDFIQGILKEKKNLSTAEIARNAEALIGAGSESTATFLSGVIYALLVHPEYLEKVTSEVRSSFQSEDEITLTSVQHLDYMLACLNETFRYYPPVTNGMPRITPNGGSLICGTFIPANTVVAIWQWAICHDTSLWTDPYEFRPERFLRDKRFQSDKLEALQPFSVGTRNCIGRNLSYAETRLILARIIFNFDMKLHYTSKDWMKEQKAYFVWDPPELNVLLRRRKP